MRRDRVVNFSATHQPSVRHILGGYTVAAMGICSVCGERFADEIRFLNHMMEKHGFRNPNVGKPDRNSRGY